MTDRRTGLSYGVDKSMPVDVFGAVSRIDWAMAMTTYTAGIGKYIVIRLFCFRFCKIYDGLI